jgi:hypothetical protein
MSMLALGAFAFRRGVLSRGGGRMPSGGAFTAVSPPDCPSLLCTHGGTRHSVHATGALVAPGAFTADGGTAAAEEE